jgi:hypothetical protein
MTLNSLIKGSKYRDKARAPPRDEGEGLFQKAERVQRGGYGHHKRIDHAIGMACRIQHPSNSMRLGVHSSMACLRKVAIW